MNQQWVVIRQAIMKHSRSQTGARRGLWNRFLTQFVPFFLMLILLSWFIVLIGDWIA